MAKSSTQVYVCAKCDAQYPKWTGRCEECGSWGSIPNESVVIGIRQEESKTQIGIAKKPVSLVSGDKESTATRYISDIEEFDRVIGGGILEGSITLFGGDPGIGKSTLILDVAHRIALKYKKPVLYVSGEESVSQVGSRARRLGATDQKLLFIEGDAVEDIIATIRSAEPSLVVVDSIQTIHSIGVSGEEGSISQIKACTTKLLHTAKETGIPIVLIGHVTKDGNVAGPMSLEHLVDVVLYIEGDPKGHYRIVRAVKNRFGSIDEVGVFEMKENGLIGVEDTTALFLRLGTPLSAGCVTTCVVDGKRTFFVEIQALTTRTTFGYPKRAAVGVELNRLQLLLAVLGQRGNIDLSSYDVYCNVANGFKLREPAADLAEIIAIASSAKDIPLKDNYIIIGEVGLSGEVRSVSHIERRINDAYKIGFRKCIAPVSKIEKIPSGMDVIQVSNIKEAIEKVL